MKAGIINFEVFDLTQLGFEPVTSAVNIHARCSRSVSNE